VTFTNEFGYVEPGIDEGGLTAELHAQFWRHAVSPASELFERGSEGGRVLPKADASLERLRLTGLMLCKSMLDDHPIGPGIARFLFEFLVFEHHEQRVFDDQCPRDALRALEDFDEQLASRWASLLEQSAGAMAGAHLIGLSMHNFDDKLEKDDPISSDNLGCAIVAGCRRRLVGDRQAALCALRDGFRSFDKIDLTLQLASLSCDDMLRLVQGKLSMSSEDLISCVDWEKSKQGFPEGSRACEFFRAFIMEADETESFRLLRWCTGLAALPAQGMIDDKICLEWDGIESGVASRYPVAHTCTRQIDLPNYASLDVLRARMQQALLEENDGFYER